MNMRKAIIIILAIGFTHGSLAQVRTLSQFLDQALANSPLLKAYRNQAQVNQLDSLRIRAVYRPQVTGNSMNMYAPTIKGFGYDNVVTNGALVSALVGVNQQVVSQENLNTQFRTLQLQTETLGNTARITEQDLKRTVSAQYIQAYSDLQQVLFAREIIGQLRKEEGVLKQLTERNVYKQSEYLTFLVAIKQEELSLRQSELQYRNDYAGLNYLCGTYDTTLVSLAEPPASVVNLPDPGRSAFFHQFTLDSLMLANSRDLVAFNYRPKLSLYADGGYLSSFTYQAYKNFGISAGLNLSVPIYDGHQRKLQYNKLSLAEQTRAGYRDFFSRQYDQQLAQLRQQLSGTESLMAEINAQVGYSESLMRVNAKLLETGDVRIADDIIALNSFLNAKYLLIQNRVTRMQIINQINYWNR
jgi:outer membrane protein TolC